jgi:hypothetical protein
MFVPAYLLEAYIPELALTASVCSSTYRASHEFGDLALEDLVHQQMDQLDTT